MAGGRADRPVNTPDRKIGTAEDPIDMIIRRGGDGRALEVHAALLRQRSVAVHLTANRDFERPAN